MRTLFVLAALSAAACGARAGRDTPPTAPSPADPRREAVQAVFKGLQAAEEAAGAEFKKAKTDADRERLRGEFQAAVKAAADKLLKLAAEKPDDEPAFNALGFALGNGDAAAAADLLAKHHLAREQVAGLLAEAGTMVQQADDPTPPPAVVGLFRAALDTSPLPAVKAAGLMGLAAAALTRADRGGDVAATAEAEGLLERAGKEFAGQPWQGGSVKAVAASLLADARERGVGKPAPEFRSKGLDDAPAKLSDLKGKVVVLDIWATWCGPCRAMIPHERGLVKRLEGKPFALVSVSADAKKEALTSFLKDTPMPWTHWHEGDGPNLKAWRVEAFPTIYVLDPKGVVRYKGVRGEELDKAVDKLLAEAK